MRRIHYLFVWLVGLCSCVWGAEGYSTARLQVMASRLSLPGIDTLSAGEYTHFVYESHPLVVRVNSWNEVEHIGLKLFEKEAKVSKSWQVYDFLERYLLERNLVKGTEEEIRFGFDDVTFVTGNFTDALQLDGTELFNLVYQPSGGYQVKWSKAGKEILNMAFDADYQLISGCDMVELERNYLNELINFRSDSLQSCTVIDYAFTQTGTYYVREGAADLIESIRNDLYFQKDEEQGWKLVDTPKKPYQSIANCFLAKEAGEGYELAVTLDMYGYKEAKDTVRLVDWLDLCRKEGCTSYFGMKSKTDSTYTGTVFMVNEACGFIHMLSIVFPIASLEKKKGMVEGRLFVYIPLRSIKDKLLFNITDYKIIEDEN